MSGMVALMMEVTEMLAELCRSTGRYNSEDSYLPDGYMLWQYWLAASSLLIVGNKVNHLIC
jgi:hypothetical protein